MFASDRRMAVSDAERRRRGVLVMQGRATAKQMGCTGLSAFVDLPNLQYNSFFPLSSNHMLLYGLFEGFMRYTLRLDRKGRPAPAVTAVGVISSHAKNTIAARLAKILVTTDFGRQPKDITRYMGSYQMEDWMHFAETFAVLVLHADEQVRSRDSAVTSCSLFRGH
jgi:hypothetical protein